MTIELKYEDRFYNIKYDGLQFTPYLLREKADGGFTEIVLGYFQNLGPALRKIIKEDMGRSEDTVDLEGFIIRYEQATKDILGAKLEDLDI